MTPDMTAKVLRLLNLRKEVDWIAFTFNVPRAHIVKLGLDVGMRFDAHHDVMTRTPVAITDPRPGPEPFTVPAPRGNDQDHFTAPTARVPVQRSAPTPAQEQRMHPAVRPDLTDASAADLIDRSEAHPDKAVQRIRHRLFASIADLRARLIAVEAEHAAAAKAEREKATLRAKADKLRADLAELERQLGKKPKHAGANNGNGSKWSEIRAWALANNVPCSIHGRVAAETVAAYTSAHPTPQGGDHQ